MSGRCPKIIKGRPGGACGHEPPDTSEMREQTHGEQGDSFGRFESARGLAEGIDTLLFPHLTGWRNW